MTELHTIEVRYEDTDGRHVDVHEAAVQGSKTIDGNTVLGIRANACKCCDAQQTDHEYNHDNVVKVKCSPTEHERKEREVSPLMWWLPLLLVMLATSIAFVAFILSVSGGTVSL